MKKYFEQAIAFDRDNPLNQRTGLGKKYNELVDEYNALEEKYNKAVGIEETSADDTEVQSDDTSVNKTDDQPATGIGDHGENVAPATENKDTTEKSHKSTTSLFGKK